MPKVSPATPRVPPADELAFVANYDASLFARPSVAVDLVVLTVKAGSLRLLAVRRAEPPYRGEWALPGGFVRIGGDFGVRGESLDAALARELKEETGLSISDVDVLQLGAFGEADRDPRTRVISVAYYALVRPDLIDKVRPGGDAAETAWLDATAELALAFDHNEIVAHARVRLRERLDNSNVARSLLAASFTVSELRAVTAIITGVPQDTGNFRRRFQSMLASGVVEATDKKRTTASKPAALYRFMHSTNKSKKGAAQ